MPSRWREKWLLNVAWWYYTAKTKPVKPGFLSAHKPGFTGLKMGGLPGFSGTRVSFPIWRHVHVLLHWTSVVGSCAEIVHGSWTSCPASWSCCCCLYTAAFHSVHPPTCTYKHLIIGIHIDSQKDCPVFCWMLLFSCQLLFYFAS